MVDMRELLVEVALQVRELCGDLSLEVLQPRGHLLQELRVAAARLPPREESVVGGGSRWGLAIELLGEGAQLRGEVGLVPRDLRDDADELLGHLEQGLHCWQHKGA